MTKQQLSTRDLSEAQGGTGETQGERNAGSERDTADEPRVRDQGSAREVTSEDQDIRESLLPADQGQRFTERWQEIQASFVDRPREAVADADSLVADLMQRLAASFSSERQQLESQWDSGDDVSTEELRVALTRYRSFFDRLLSA
jgi:hypothetical protein